MGAPIPDITALIVTFVELLGGAALSLVLTGPGPFAVDQMMGAPRLPSAVTRYREPERT